MGKPEDILNDEYMRQMMRQTVVMDDAVFDFLYEEHRNVMDPVYTADMMKGADEVMKAICNGDLMAAFADSYQRSTEGLSACRAVLQAFGAYPGAFAAYPANMIGYFHEDDYVGSDLRRALADPDSHECDDRRRFVFTAAFFAQQCRSRLDPDFWRSSDAAKELSSHAANTDEFSYSGARPSSRLMDISEVQTVQDGMTLLGEALRAASQENLALIAEHIGRKMMAIHASMMAGVSADINRANEIALKTVSGFGLRPK